MPVKQEFKYTTMDNSGLPKSIDEWVTTLSAEEQQKYNEADLRQRKYRQDAIDRGDLILIPGKFTTPDDLDSYVWKDEETAKRGKRWDPEWLEFWNRYTSECKVKLEIVSSEI